MRPWPAACRRVAAAVGHAGPCCCALVGAHRGGRAARRGRHAGAALAVVGSVTRSRKPLSRSAAPAQVRRLRTSPQLRAGGLAATSTPSPLAHTPARRRMAVSRSLLGLGSPEQLQQRLRGGTQRGARAGRSRVGNTLHTRLIHVNKLIRGGGGARAAQETHGQHRVPCTGRDTPPRPAPPAHLGAADGPELHVPGDARALRRAGRAGGRSRTQLTSSPRCGRLGANLCVRAMRRTPPCRLAPQACPPRARLFVERVLRGALQRDERPPRQPQPRAQPPLGLAAAGVARSAAAVRSCGRCVLCCAAPARPSRPARAQPHPQQLGPRVVAPSAFQPQQLDAGALEEGREQRQVAAPQVHACGPPPARHTSTLGPAPTAGQERSGARQGLAGHRALAQTCPPHLKRPQWDQRNSNRACRSSRPVAHLQNTRGGSRLGGA